MRSLELDKYLSSLDEQVQQEEKKEPTLEDRVNDCVLFSWHKERQRLERLLAILDLIEEADNRLADHNEIVGKTHILPNVSKYHEQRAFKMCDIIERISNYYLKIK